MPIRKENRRRYPKDWAVIAYGRKKGAGWRCEGSPAYPDCRAKHGDPHPVTGAKVVLTVAHLDHTPENCSPENLRAWCQRCHNTYDAPARAVGRADRLRMLRSLWLVALDVAAGVDGVALDRLLVPMGPGQKDHTEAAARSRAAKAVMAMADPTVQDLSRVSGLHRKSLAQMLERDDRPEPVAYVKAEVWRAARLGLWGQAA